MSLNTSIQEKVLFLNTFINSPKQIGSVIPSSNFLCMKMIESVPWDEVESLAELGSGTGAITKHIQGAKRERTKVLLFEKEASLVRLLKKQYADFPCYPDACQLEKVIQAEQIQKLDCILSCLPFFNFPQEIRDQLMEQIVMSLKPNGLFIAFQYSMQMKKQLASLFDIEKIHFVPFNFPPAFVYVCRKRG